MLLRTRLRDRFAAKKLKIKRPLYGVFLFLTALSCIRLNYSSDNQPNKPKQHITNVSHIGINDPSTRSSRCSSLAQDDPELGERVEPCPFCPVFNRSKYRNYLIYLQLLMSGPREADIVSLCFSQSGANCRFSLSISFLSTLIGYRSECISRKTGRNR